MNNRRGMMSSLLTIGAASAAIYGITKGVQNGTFQRLPETISNTLNSPQVQQLTQPLQNLVNNQNTQQLNNAVQQGTDNLQQQMGINQNNQ
ncbi:hypothetical protein [Oceanobacillus rekensis]|uniref:hypothetical protein n=1 Tax=Oceanobacillus rekensis TaxID=937927 RepID=UPI000B444CF7|nr:hypothetical protein [Oceanobacillus rekensis]